MVEKNEITNKYPKYNKSPNITCGYFNVLKPLSSQKRAHAKIDLRKDPSL